MIIYNLLIGSDAYNSAATAIFDAAHAVAETYEKPNIESIDSGESSTSILLSSDKDTSGTKNPSK